MPDLSDNPYEEAFPEEVEKLREDIDAVFDAWDDGNLSRPGFSNELLGIAKQFNRYAKYTEQNLP